MCRVGGRSVFPICGRGAEPTADAGGGERCPRAAAAAAKGRVGGADRVYQMDNAPPPAGASAAPVTRYDPDPSWRPVE